MTIYHLFPIWQVEDPIQTEIAPILREDRLPAESATNRLMSKDFEISRLLELASGNKYEVTVAAFQVIDQLDQIDINKKYINRKPAVKAMVALTENLVKYDYITDEQRQELQEELNKSKTKAALDSVFKTSGSAAPIADDSEEELDEIGETEPIEGLEESSDDDSDRPEESEDEDDDKDEDEDDDKDDDKDDVSDDSDDDKDDDKDDDSDDSDDDKE